MLDNKFFLLLVNFLWLAGLFGTLFALAYMVQYRRQRWWNVGNSTNVPRTLVPLYLALATFCSGLTLHAYVAQTLISFGVAAVWAILALLFLVRLVHTLGLGIQLGWDAPLLAPMTVAPWQRVVSWPALALCLLIANVALLGWWSNQQLNADPTQATTTQVEGEFGGLTTLIRNPFAAAPTVTSVPLTVMTPRLSVKVSAPVTTTPTLAPTLSPVTGALTATATSQIPLAAVAVVTLAPASLQVTPTPLAGITLATPTPAGIVALPAIATATPQPNASTGLTATLALSSTIIPITPTAVVAEPVPAGVTGLVQSPPGANVRAAPATTAAVLTLLADRTPLTLTGRTADGAWLALRLADGTEGWIAASLVNADAALVTTLPTVP